MSAEKINISFCVIHCLEYNVENLHTRCIDRIDISPH